MRAVGLKVLKNKLSEYVRLAGNGERVLVTDRDRVVAELIAPQPTSMPVALEPATPTPLVTSSPG
jgi:antitoxin (DNA-binding transcriptional repressor) of toxin-antitoxin stability system